MTAQGFDIVSIDEVTVTSLVGALSEVFGTRSEEWYEWKHLDNPAGRSLGWVAIDGQGVVGVRLFQRWDLTAGEHRIRALRPVDTMTLPRARRRGVFKRLLSTAIDSVQAAGIHDVIFNTPNQNSRDGYAKGGWLLLPEITHGRMITTPGRRFGSRIRVECLPTGIPDGQGRIATNKTEQYLSWRYDRRGGRDYRAATGPGGEASIVYRIATPHRVRTLLLLESFGEASAVRRLVSGTARREHALTIMFASGAGTDAAIRPLIQRGSSVLAVRQLRTVEPNPLDIGSWSLTLGDLEDVL